MKATKVRLYPTTEQAEFLHRQFGAVRFVYNSGLRIMSHRYKHHGQSLSAVASRQDLPEVRLAERGGLNGAPAGEHQGVQAVAVGTQRRARRPSRRRMSWISVSTP
ncbi:helix-turn-helix domain-containing protein [Azotobacter chroococcum]|nr:helix-turn-helix domain-containing protein [Azotobacter chroococcum]